MIELKILEKNELKEWDKIAIESPYDTIFHTLEWMGILDVKGDLNGKN
jgi:hypothetical protein